MQSKKINTPRLKNIPDRNIAIRLRTLREQRRLTLMEVAEKLQSHVNINLEGNVGRSAISNLENQNQNLTVELAIAYSKAFNVSLEYVLCLSEDMQPENKEIKDVLGLSDLSIDVIKNYPKGDYVKPYLAILNTLYESGFMTEMIEAFDRFVYFVNRSSDLLNVEANASVDIMPIAKWNLNNEIYSLIEKIIGKLIDEYSYLYEMEAWK